MKDRKAKSRAAAKRATRRVVRSRTRVNASRKRHSTEGSVEEYLDRLRVEAFDGSAPETLCHYTDEAGLRGLLGEGKIWYTAFESVADQKEFAHEDGLVRDAIARLKETERGANMKVLQNLDDTRSVNSVAAKIGGNGYLFCLTDARDSVAHWSRFTNRGRGFCIEFAILKEEVRDNDIGRGGPRPVEYSSATMASRLEDVLRKTLRCRRASAVQKLRHGRLCVAYAGMLYKPAAQYGMEREWRATALTRPGSGRGFEAGGKRRIAVPGRPNGLPPVVRSVVIGPGFPPLDAQEAIALVQGIRECHCELSRHSDVWPERASTQSLPIG